MFNVDSKIYVAGHHGLLGSAFLRRLNNDGYKNILVRTREELDLTNTDAVDEFFRNERPEYVVLAAGKVGGIVENKNFPFDFIRNNLELQVSIFKSAEKYQIKKLVFFGSSCMYPKNCSQPMSELALLTGIPEPTSIAYAVSKIAGVQMCLSYNQQNQGIYCLPVIPNSVYGPNDNFDLESSHVLSALIRRFYEAKLANQDFITLWGSGTPKREFIYVDDLVDACLKLLVDQLEPDDLPINIGTGFEVTIEELAKMVAKVVGFSGQIRWDINKPDGSPRKLLDSSRLNSMGWRASTSLQDGLEATYEWYVNSLKDN